MTHVKICGLRTPEQVAAARGADAIGLVVASPQSHRDLPLDEAARLARLCGPFQTSVAVTAERDLDVLRGIVRVVRPQALQVPFRAGGAVFHHLRADFPLLRILVACRPEDAHLAPVDADALVLDAATADGYGGTGRLTDWGAARGVRESARLPIVLAGGLTPDNVADAVRAVRPYGVDVSSGVETEKAKDAKKIEAFIANARGA